MKIRHKKIILLTILSLMGIGMLTFSMKNQEPQLSIPTDNLLTQSIPTPTPPLVMESSPIIIPDSKESEKVKENKGDNLLQDAPVSIEELIREYYLAKAYHDIEKIKSLITDTEYAPTEESLKASTLYIEEYKNITTKMKKTYVKEYYVVYVYLEIKYINIKTLVPRLDKFLIHMEDGELPKIYSAPMDEMMAEYYKERNQDEDVVKLIEYTNQNLEKAKEKDEDLKIFLEQLSKTE